MDINHMHLAVKDVPTSQAFYNEYFGFQENVTHGEVVFLRNSAGFDLAIDPKVTPVKFPDWFHFGFRLESVRLVEELYFRLAKHPQFIKTEIAHEPGFVWFRAQDPDGYIIEVYWE